MLKIRDLGSQNGPEMDPGGSPEAPKMDHLRKKAEKTNFSQNRPFQQKWPQLRWPKFTISEFWRPFFG